jgi:hypothetical protein
VLIPLPDTSGSVFEYRLVGTPIAARALSQRAVRRIFSAAHVVADPYADADPGGRPAIDWKATLAFRRHLASLGLGIAEAMDTAQRGMGLDWPTALELIARTRAELPEAAMASGCGTDHLDPGVSFTLDEVCRAYLEQAQAIQALGGRLILMASRSLARAAQRSADYVTVYDRVLAECDQPVILHWLGEMFDPALAGYWGSSEFPDTMRTALEVIHRNAGKIDGIKISLLDKDKEITMRRLLPTGVRMYTGDDFNYPELIEGDDRGYSDALLGIFDPLATAAAHAVALLTDGNLEGYRRTLDPTVLLARHLFRAPTRFYKTGVVFLAWLNGFQDHFVMVGGAQSARALPYFTEAFRLADRCGALISPDLAVKRMRAFLAVYGAA